MTREEVADPVGIEGLSVSAVLHRFVAQEALPGSGVDETTFWGGLSSIVHDLSPTNRELLAVREELQTQIDRRYRGQDGEILVDEETFLRRIGYLVEEPADFEISTISVDDEIARVAGPQLVVPLLNARFAVNAANARWGSLYDALYGTDAISREGDLAPTASYNATRGRAVVDRARAFLDEIAPLAGGSHRDSTGYAIDGGVVVVSLVGGTTTTFLEPETFVGYQGDPAEPTAVLLAHHGLHIEIEIDRASRSAPRMPPASRTSSWRPPSRRSSTAKTRSRPSMPRTRRGLPQLVRLMQGRLAEVVTRTAVTSAARSIRIALRRPGRPAAHAPRSQPALDPQRRDSHGDRRGARRPVTPSPRASSMR